METRAGESKDLPCSSDPGQPQATGYDSADEPPGTQAGVTDQH